MFSVAIIIPSWHYWSDPTRLQPLYEMHFASVLESRFKETDVRISIIDLRGIALDQQVRHIAEHDLYLYWIMKSGDYSEIEFIVAELRRYYQKARHVSGGTHVHVCADECRDVFDSIVLGPGEEAFTEVIHDAIAGNMKKEYKDDFNKIHYGNYSFMRRHFLPETAIVNCDLFEKYGENIRGTCVLFSRGCNYKCAYCVYNVPDKIQMKPFQLIADEIEYLKKEYQVQAINLKDEIALPVSVRKVIPFLETIALSNVMWRGQTTIWGAKAEHLKLAAESGCVELAVGVESASEIVRNVINKQISDREIRMFIDNCHKFKIKVKMCLILGLPAEPGDIVERTIRFIEDMGPDYLSVSGFDPFPGSPIYNNMDYYGIKYVDKDWGKHAHLLYRFSNDEDVGLPFEYKEYSQWGKTFSREQIAENLRQIQSYSRDKGMVY
jgi:radical SAM superfamily enzyme YgiQ (UPF0313 family)